ncbi:LOW QUALITY PROTEIN: berberine bridge enzyme-like 22 [Dioscorea cayenensis subsp. rotundata]|uniref:LOW QUALITY PROTEIN: berberine bridge enzyme-like 22 n=1 Tax=Dioscorea cayennensis subsp. rotundata TaxID=55577 RepID=A0AB40AJW9_DIOCR|nr:LOW QUALITY PROTEIN: berberine bridge enzyme-like 22 [Dioscorea cayenensis subsp. rotundata]
MKQMVPPETFFFFFSFLFLSFHACFPITPETLHTSFTQCFQNHSHHPSIFNLIIPSNTTAYTNFFHSSIKNTRLVMTNTTHTTFKPLFIISPTLKSHVQASVVCAARHGLRLRTMSGGHDYEGLSYISHHDHPFIILNLSKLRSIHIAGDIAWVQAGATLGELYHEIAKKNKSMGFPAGLCPTVGVGGHFSGGGFGTLVRKYGLAADNIIDAHLVDVNGRVLNRETMGEDLFWAIRGGGGASFGVILAYKIKLVEVPPKVTVFTIHRTLSQGATKLVNKWEHIAYELNERLFIRVLFLVKDNIENKGRNNKTIEVLFNSLFLGSREELLPIMEDSFPELGLEANDCKEMRWIKSVLYMAWYPKGTPVSTLLDRNPPRLKNSLKGKSDFVTEHLNEKVWERIWKKVLGGGESLIMILDPFGGRMDDISETETPFPHRKGNMYSIQYLMKWKRIGDEDDKKHVDWLRRFYEFMASYVSKNPRAAYLNYRDLDLGQNQGGGVSYSKSFVWGHKYYKGNFKRLAYVKSLVDPDNFFKHEQSIPPL